MPERPLSRHHGPERPLQVCRRNRPEDVMIGRMARRPAETRTACSHQIIYAITSIPADILDAAGLLALSRAHWQIENRLFRVRTCQAPKPWPICAMSPSP